MKGFELSANTQHNIVSYFTKFCFWRARTVSYLFSLPKETKSICYVASVSWQCMFEMTVQRHVSPELTWPQQWPKSGVKILRSSQEPRTGKTHYNYLLEDKINTPRNVKVLLSDGTQTRNKPRLTQDSICLKAEPKGPVGPTVYRNKGIIKMQVWTEQSRGNRIRTVLMPQYKSTRSIC